jgi:hypothetical protein
MKVMQWTLTIALVEESYIVKARMKPFWFSVAQAWGEEAL